MGGCPIADEKADGFKQEVIIILSDNKNLVKVNGEAITAEDREAAMKEKEERERAAQGLPPADAEAEEDDE